MEDQIKNILNRCSAMGNYTREDAVRDIMRIIDAKLKQQNEDMRQWLINEGLELLSEQL